jgi:tetratricopeptide (TPR) repeat protein
MLLQSVDGLLGAADRSCGGSRLTARSHFVPVACDRKSAWERRNGQTLRHIAMCFFLFAGAPVAGANDLDDCNQTADADRRIRGCTRLIIERGTTEPELLSFFYDNRGIAYSNKGEFDRSIADHTKAIELNLTDAVPYYHRALSHFQMKSFDQAIVDFSKAAEIKPKFVSAYYNRGGAYLYKGGSRHRRLQ